MIRFIQVKWHCAMLRFRSRRYGAAFALKELGSPAAIGALARALDNPNQQARLQVVFALGQLGDVRAIEPLIVALHDSDDGVRIAAIKALGNLGDVRAVEPLVTALQDSNRKVRQAAIEELSQLGDVRAVEPLVTALQDSNREVRQAAVEALSQMGYVRAVEPLMAALKDPNYQLRQAAVEVLNRLRDVRSVEPLVTALQDSNHNVRQVAAKALGQLGDVRAVEPLIAALRDPSDEVRQAAVEALGQTRDVRAVEPLIATLAQLQQEEWMDVSDCQWQKWEMRKATIEALGQLGDARAVEPLIAVLAQLQQEEWMDVSDCQWQKREMRKATIEALGQLGDVRAVEPLVELIEWTKTSMQIAFNKIASYSRDLSGDDYDALKHSAIKIQIAVVNALAQLGAIEPLSERLKDGNRDVRREALAALNGLALRGDVRVVEPLVAVLKTSDRYVDQTVAKTALEKLFDISLSIPQAQLLEMTTLGTAIGFREIDDGCDNYHDDEGNILDFSKLRQLARQELVRRETGQAVLAPATPPLAAQIAPTISFACSHCQKRFRVAAKHAGRQTPCPACRREIAIPMK
jgi:HEAT repeat protein